MPKHYKLDNAQMLLNDEELRKRYITKLEERLSDLTPRKPFPELIFLHDEKRQVTFTSVLATAGNRDLQDGFLTTKLDHMSRRWEMENDAKLRNFILHKTEGCLNGVKTAALDDKRELNRAYALLACLQEKTLGVSTTRQKDFKYLQNMQDPNWQKFVHLSRHSPLHGVPPFSLN